MAKINKAVLGLVKGKLGDMVFREMYGEKYVSVRPDHYNVSQTEKAKEGRANFASAILFSKMVNSQPALKQIWSDSPFPGKRSYTKIFKANVKRVKKGDISLSNIITPGGLVLKINSPVIQNNILSAALSIPDADKLVFPLKVFIFFCFGKKDMFYQEAGIDLPVPGNQYSLNIFLNSDIENYLSVNPEPLLFMAAAGKPVNKNYWSQTCSVKL